MEIAKALYCFAPILNRHERWHCLAYLWFELCFDDNKKVVGNFIGFSKSLGSPLMDVWISVHAETSAC